MYFFRSAIMAIEGEAEDELSDDQESETEDCETEEDKGRILSFWDFSKNPKGLNPKGLFLNSGFFSPKIFMIFTPIHTV